MNNTTKLKTTAANLDRVISQAIRAGQADENAHMTDSLRLMSRLCAGRGGRVPLPQLQQGPNGRNFISDPQARFHELTKDWGFDIVCVTTWRDGEKHSTRHIVLGQDRMPTIDHSAPKRRGGLHQPTAAAPKPVQAVMLSSLVPNCQTFQNWETGVTR